jgi:hypothetical protein
MSVTVPRCPVGHVAKINTLCPSSDRDRDRDGK